MIYYGTLVTTDKKSLKIYDKISKQEQICLHLQLLGNFTKVIKVKSYI